MLLSETNSGGDQFATSFDGTWEKRVSADIEGIRQCAQSPGIMVIL